MRTRDSRLHRHHGMRASAIRCTAVLNPAYPWTLLHLAASHLTVAFCVVSCLRMQAAPCRVIWGGDLGGSCLKAVQDDRKPQLSAENAAYAREVAELFASSRRGIGRSSTGSLTSPAVARTPFAGSGVQAARSGPSGSAGAMGQPIQASSIPTNSCKLCISVLGEERLLQRSCSKLCLVHDGQPCGPTTCLSPAFAIRLTLSFTCATLHFASWTLKWTC